MAIKIKNPISSILYESSYTQVTSASSGPTKLVVHFRSTITDPLGQAASKINVDASGIMISKSLVLTADHVFKSSGTALSGTTRFARGEISGGVSPQYQELIASASVSHGTIAGGGHLPNNKSVCSDERTSSGFGYISNQRIISPEV